MISGQTIYVKLRFAADKPRVIDDLFILDQAGHPLGGLKMANGTNSIRSAPWPGTRGKSAYLVREQFIKAREYQAKVDSAKADATKLPPRDEHLETLIEAMQGQRIVHYHTHRHDDIMSVLRLAEEFHLHVVLHHVSEGWKVADEIARAKVPCSIILIDSPGGKLEAQHLRFETGKTPGSKPVSEWPFIPMTGSPIHAFSTAWRRWRYEPACRVTAALEALTLAGAEILNLQDRIGSLEPGKDADFVVLSGDPLSVYTHVLETWVEGSKAFDRANPQDHLYAVGGYGAGHDQSPYYCCFEQGEQE